MAGLKKKMVGGMNMTLPRRSHPPNSSIDGISQGSNQKAMSNSEGPGDVHS